MAFRVEYRDCQEPSAVGIRELALKEAIANSASDVGYAVHEASSSFNMGGGYAAAIPPSTARHQ